MTYYLCEASLGYPKTNTTRTTPWRRGQVSRGVSCISGPLCHHGRQALGTERNAEQVRPTRRPLPKAVPVSRTDLIRMLIGCKLRDVR
jgi:hypothetical protein